MIRHFPSEKKRPEGNKNYQNQNDIKCWFDHRLVVSKIKVTIKSNFKRRTAKHVRNRLQTARPRIPASQLHSNKVSVCDGIPTDIFKPFFSDLVKHMRILFQKISKMLKLSKNKAARQTPTIAVKY